MLDRSDIHKKRVKEGIYANGMAHMKMCLLNNIIYLFFIMYFGCAGSLLLRARLSLVAVPVVLFHGSSCCGVWGSVGAWVSVAVAHRLQSRGSVVVMHGLSCSSACGIFLEG